VLANLHDWNDSENAATARELLSEALALVSQIKSDDEDAIDMTPIARDADRGAIALLLLDDKNNQPGAFELLLLDQNKKTNPASVVLAVHTLASIERAENA
jgi:hypothetical protein